MHTPGITIKRFPFEEPYHLNLLIEASNGRNQGMLEYYCNASDLTALGKKLADFGGTTSEEVVYEIGSEKTEDRFAMFLSLRAKACDSSGHCALTIRLNNNRQPPNREVSEFSIEANVADLNRLGNLLVEFARLKHRMLIWTVNEGRLLETVEGEG